MKRFLWLLFGIILGVAGTLGFLYISGLGEETAESKDYEMSFFDQPKEVMSAREYQVVQAWPNGTALAMDYDNPMTIVLLWNKDHDQYYDGQTIKADRNQVFRHIGLCRYKPANENLGIKTVPIVELTGK